MLSTEDGGLDAGGCAPAVCTIILQRAQHPRRAPGWVAFLTMMLGRRWGFYGHFCSEVPSAPQSSRFRHGQWYSARLPTTYRGYPGRTDSVALCECAGRIRRDRAQCGVAGADPMAGDSAAGHPGLAGVYAGTHRAACGGGLALS